MMIHYRILIWHLYLHDLQTEHGMLHLLRVGGCADEFLDAVGGPQRRVLRQLAQPQQRRAADRRPGVVR